MFETGLKTGQEISFIPEIDLQEKARAMAYDFIEQMRAEGIQIPIDQDVINQHISHLYVVDKDEFFRLTDQLRGKINNTFLKALAKVGKVGGACFSFKAGSDELPYNIIYLDDNYSSDNTLAHEVQHAVDNIVGIKYKHEQTLDYALRPKLAYAGVIAGFVALFLQL